MTSTCLLAAVAHAACLLSLVLVAPLPAQEPDSTRVQEDTTAVRDSALVADSALLAQPRADRCVLQWEPLAPDTEGLSLREGGEAHITHVSGRMLWTCGTATMEADSAVKYDRTRRVDLIGNVAYRDTTRTLRSRFLTYFEIPDLVIATGDVELERIGDGSTLEGPRVEFVRAVSGVDELTVATGRPHMRLYPEGEDRANPFEIDADRTVFAGEDEARAYGNVIIAREDLDAAADSAYLRRIDETGVLWGSPWVDAEGVRLSGDTIRFASEADELRDVHALGNGHAIGESFEVRSERIDVELVDREVETVWAHGPGGSEAVSGAHHVYGDSLRFEMFAGSIDTLYAVGEAAAIQADGPVAVARLDDPAVEGEVADSAAVPADSVPAAAADTTGVRGDTLQAPEDTVAAPRDTVETPRDTTAAWRETVPAPPDTTAASRERPVTQTDTLPPPEPADAVPADSTTVPADSIDVPADSARAAAESAGVAADSAGVEADSAGVEADSAGVEADSARAGEPPSSRSAPIRPEPDVDGRSNWVRGDTLIAIFERAPGGARDTAGILPAADSLPAAAPGDTAAALPSADSLAVFPGLDAPTEPADTAAEPRMERLIVIGNASSFYRQVRDTSRTSRPSRNYMIGKRIDVLFEAGEPKTVKGTAAIGIYLEPEEGATDEGAAVSDPGAAQDSFVIRDSVLVLPDSIPPDSVPAPPDSAAAAPDSTVAPPDSVAAARGLEPLALTTGSGTGPPRSARPSVDAWLRRERT